MGRKRPGVPTRGLNSVAPYLLGWQRWIRVLAGQTVMSGASPFGSGGGGRPELGDKLSRFAPRGFSYGLWLLS